MNGITYVCINHRNWGKRKGLRVERVKEFGGEEGENVCGGEWKWGTWGEGCLEEKGILANYP